jgi:hypothetical protein
LYSLEKDRRGRFSSFAMVSMMDILSRRCPLMVDVRQTGARPLEWRSFQ